MSIDIARTHAETIVPLSNRNLREKEYLKVEIDMDYRNYYN